MRLQILTKCTEIFIDWVMWWYLVTQQPVRYQYTQTICHSNEERITAHEKNVRSTNTRKMILILMFIPFSFTSIPIRYSNTVLFIENFDIIRVMEKDAAQCPYPINIGITHAGKSRCRQTSSSPPHRQPLQPFRR